MPPKGSSTRGTKDIGYPKKADGSRDERYSGEQVLKKDGTRDQRTTPIKHK
jgi:hypothetical protein